MNPLTSTDQSGTFSSWDVIRFIANKLVIDPSFEKGEKLLGHAWVETFWNQSAVPLIGDKDYSPVAKASLALIARIAATQSVGKDCAVAAEDANQGELDRKKSEALRLWWERHSGDSVGPEIHRKV